VDSSSPLNPETTDASLFVCEPESNEEIEASSPQLANIYENEHAGVLGARVGACLFSSFFFPTTLWAVGAATPALAGCIAVSLSLLTARPILFLGGHRVGRVVLLEIALAAVLLPPVLGPLAAVPAAIFFPLLGMLGTATIAARLAERAFAQQDELPREIEAAVARAMQSNVVDIRSADAARRPGKKTRGQATGTAVAHSLQSQV